MKYKWTVEFTIDETWVEDGFNLTTERANDMILSSLPYATTSEVKAKTIKAPLAKDIKKAQS